MSNLVLKLNNDTEILVDPLNFILKRKGDYTFYPDLEFLVEEMFEDEIKIKLAESKKKELTEILKTIKECRDEVKKVSLKLHGIYPEAVRRR